jgi:hypothetical protein
MGVASWGIGDEGTRIDRMWIRVPMNGMTEPL